MNNPNEIVVGTKYRVVPTQRELKDPKSIRENMKVTRAYANQLNDELKHGGLIGFDIDEEKTKAYHNGETVNLADLEQLGYTVKPTPPKTKNKYIQGIEDAETIDSLREFFNSIPNNQKRKEVKDAFAAKIKTLSNEN